MPNSNNTGTRKYNVATCLRINRAILVSQLDVSVLFLQKLSAVKVITEEHLAKIKVITSVNDWLLRET